MDMTLPNSELLGIGLYTPAEASRYLGVQVQKLRRWLKGHHIGDRKYPPLWDPEVDLGDQSLHLGFRDLLEMRAAHAFMAVGVSPQQIRRAILEARQFVNDERPLSTTRFQTDGRTVFLEIAREDGDTQLLDLFKKQYAIRDVLKQSFKDVDYELEAPARWWIAGRKQGIVLDPRRSFGQPVDDKTGVPTRVLAAAAAAEGGIEAAAKAWEVSRQTIERAVAFEQEATKGAA